MDQARRDAEAENARRSRVMAGDHSDDTGTNGRLLRWDDAHDGSPAQLGFDGTWRLVGQVAFYDVVGGHGPGWVGYVHGKRVTGRCRDSATARALVEERAG